MVHAPIPRAPRSSRRPDRPTPGRCKSRRRSGRGLAGFVAGVFVTGLTAVATAPAADPPADPTEEILWTSARLGGSIGRQAIDTSPLMLAAGHPAEVYLVLEGVRAGLPVYCCALPRLRIDGRAVPGRMIVAPAAAGLEGREVRWQMLRPTADAQSWRRTRLDDPEDPWMLPILDLAVVSEDAGFRTKVGTARLAAAIRLPREGVGDPFLATDGWNKRPGWENPEDAPGYRVSRGGSGTLEGWAEAYAGLPVIDDATAAHARELVAISPRDLVLGAYGMLRKSPLPGSRDVALDDPEWAWLLETRVAIGFRKTRGSIPWVAERGQGIRWNRIDGTEGPTVRSGDIVLMDTGPAFLRRDDGDGWLDNDDLALTIRDGALAHGTLDELPGGQVKLLRPRNFRSLRLGLREAGYGELHQDFFYGTDVERAVADFQRDHGLPVTGLPDRATLEAIDEFLTRMREAGSESAEPGS